MPIRKTFAKEEEAVGELTSAVIRGRLFGIDDAGAEVVVSQAQITTMTGTLYDLVTGTVLNSFQDVNFLIDSRATIDAGGNLVVRLKPEDSPIVTATAEVNLTPRNRVKGERHLLLIRVTWDSPTRAAAHEWVFTVVNLGKVG